MSHHRPWVRAVVTAVAGVLVAISVRAQPPALSLDDLRRLQCFASRAPQSTIPAPLASLFHIADRALASKAANVSSSVGAHVILFSLETPDIILVYRTPTGNYFYLTDSTRELRAAATTTEAGVATLRSASVEDSRAEFERQLSVWKQTAAKNGPADCL